MLFLDCFDLEYTYLSKNGRIFYLSPFTSRSDVLNTFDYFNELVTQPSFKPWELNDHLPIRMLEDIKNMDMPTLALELLHKAAYRNGLGNSLYSPEFMVGKHDSDLLLDFHRKTHTLTRY